MHQIQESHLNLPWNRVDFCGSICSSCMVYTSMWLNWGAIPQLSVFSFRPPYSRCLLAWRGGRDLGDWLTWLIDWLTDIRYYMMVMMMMMMKSLLRLIHYRIPFRGILHSWELPTVTGTSAIESLQRPKRQHNWTEIADYFVTYGRYQSTIKQFNLTAINPSYEHFYGYQSPGNKNQNEMFHHVFDVFKKRWWMKSLFHHDWIYAIVLLERLNISQLAAINGYVFIATI